VGIRCDLQYKILHKDTFSCYLMVDNRVIVFAYLPPNTNNEDFRNFLLKLVEFTVKYQHHDIVLMGDLNCRIGSSQNSIGSSQHTRISKENAVNTRGRILLKELGSINLNVLNGCVAGDSYGEFTYVCSNGASVIDLCLGNYNVLNKISNFKIVNLSYSRHFPIQLKFKSKRITEQLDCKSYKKIAWDSNKYEMFCSALLQSSSSSSSSNISEFIDMVYNAAVSCELIKECKLNRNQTVRGPAWFNSECVQAEKQVQLKLKNLRKSKKNNSINFNTALTVYLNAKREYKSVEKLAKTAYYTNIQQKLRNSKDAKQFYNTLNMYRNNKNHNNPKVIIPIEEFNQPEIEQINTKVEELDKSFTLEELDLAIRKIKPNKAPGSDGIPNEVWKALPNINKQDLLNIFNEIFESGNFPISTCEILISPLYKKSDPSLPTNYRPLSLANTILKLFTQILSNRLLDWSSKNKIISDYQAAYKRKSGCIDHVFLLTSTIQYNFHIKRKVYGLFVDMSKAFDTVDHKRLWFKLGKLGVSTKVITVLKYIYKNANAKIRTNYDISDSFSIDRGVLQGETVSPILWNLYLEDIIQILDKSDTIPVKLLDSTIHALLYADDIILLAYSPAELQKK